MMVTPLNYGVTLIERNAATQNWASPSAIDLDNFVFGETYIWFPSERDDDRMNNDTGRESFPGGTVFSTPLGVFTDDVPLDGLVEPNDLATLKLIKKFFAKHRKIGHERTYLIIKYEDGFMEYIDPNDLMLEYCVGWISDMAFPFDAKEQQRRVRGMFQVSWNG